MRIKFVVVFEKTPNNYCAYVPDLPGCISTGRTWEEMQAMIREAVPFHIEGMMENGDPLPETTMSLEEAMAYHIEPIPDYVMESYARYGDEVPTLSTTFEIIEFEVNPSPCWQDESKLVVEQPEDAGEEAYATNIVVADDVLTAELADGRSISVPLTWYPRLLHGTPEERNNWELFGEGRHIHWPDLDEDLSVEGFLAGSPSGESRASLERWLEAKKSGLPVNIHEIGRTPAEADGEE